LLLAANGARAWVLAPCIAIGLAVVHFTQRLAAQTAEPPAETPVVLPPVTVEAEAEAERGDGPVRGYRATRSTTPTRTDTPILETPASISVVPRELFRDLNAQTPGDVLRAIPSVAQRQNFQGAEAFTIRGFFVDGDNGYQIDGLRTRNILQLDPALFERVEVLKGPASLLYGTVEPGGVVNFVSPRPTADSFASGGVEVGSYDDVRGTLDGSYRFASGVGVRLPVAARRFDSFRDDVDDNRSIGLTPSVEIPIGERTTARLLVAYFDQELVTTRSSSRSSTASPRTSTTTPSWASPTPSRRTACSRPS
jgi:catecholate siderophore receptor